ncbi:MAG: ArgE/DapE family deacylase [Chloroflexota bacterium]|nr:ArgE/DapE family deacylase [Chloroflexota bacterium]
MGHGNQPPAELVRRIGDAVDSSAEELVGLVQDLVRIPSENPKLSGVEDGGEAAVQDRVERALAAIGCEIHRWDALPGRPDLVGVVKGAGGGRSLAVNGHIDVVPAGNPDDWPRGPFAAAIADGMIWGRGASDMKGGVASMIHAATILSRLGIGLKGDLLIESVIDEETGGPGTRSTIERGFRPDFAVVTEPTNLVIYPVEGGLEWLRVTITGVAGHSAQRYRTVHAGGRGTAVNALEKGAFILRAVQELERAWAVRKVHPLLPAGITTINPGVMVAGSGGGRDGMANVLTAVSTMPDYCSLELSLKYLPSEKTSEVRAEFEEYIQRVSQTDEWLRQHPPVIEWGLRGVSFPPVNTPDDHPGVLTLVESVNAVAGPARIDGFGAVADIAWFAEAGIPSVLFGPGSGAGAHGVDERVEIDQLVTGAKMLAVMMVAWCGQAEEEGHDVDRGGASSA